MAPAIALAADPDAALVRLERVAEAVGERGGPADALATDPQAALAARAPGRRQPFATDAARRRPRADHARSPTAVVHADDAQADMVAAWSRGTPARELSPARPAPRSPPSATACSARRSTSAAPDLPFAVIGMGKLGARELNFASDLDVVFVYEGEGADEHARARPGPPSG